MPKVLISGASVADAMLETKDFYFRALAQVRTESWSKGHVTLVGDAAYCPSPFTGQGASLALIGAFVLAEELARSSENPTAPFSRYMERRGPIRDDVFDAAKNAINLDDMLTA